MGDDKMNPREELLKVTSWYSSRIKLLGDCEKAVRDGAVPSEQDTINLINASRNYLGVIHDQAMLIANMAETILELKEIIDELRSNG